MSLSQRKECFIGENDTTSNADESDDYANGMRSNKKDCACTSRAFGPKVTNRLNQLEWCTCRTFLGLLLLLLTRHLPLHTSSSRTLSLSFSPWLWLLGLLFVVASVGLTWLLQLVSRGYQWLWPSARDSRGTRLTSSGESLKHTLLEPRPRNKLCTLPSYRVSLLARK